MGRSFSIYLDLIRVSAAFLVYLYHSNQRFLSETELPFSGYGHSAVVVFFVLSGFVIRHVTDTKEMHWPDYAASRIARIFSVTVPAIFLTLICDAIGRAVEPAIYAHSASGQVLARVVLSLLMLNEVWLMSVMSFSNLPFWSICVEFWYYAAFALVVFLPRRKGWVAAALLALGLGPKFILLAPIWCSGVVLYRWRWPRRLGQWPSLALVALSLIGIWQFHARGIDAWSCEWLKATLGQDRAQYLGFANYVVGDYLLALLVCMNFAGMRNLLAGSGGWLIAVERPVRLLAACTFTLYLLHMPLFLMWSAVVGGNPAQPWYWLTVTGLMLASVVLISRQTEAQRYRLRGWLLGLFERRGVAMA
ncbi:acyltransferase [Zoogloea sp. 1C4]|uniref:acyltransferase family protein n=1 Tax=Zoogloea sp. 1C4 TaxID=2570190 RepID=UPI0012915B9E|nr:acyltransferase [Zoogloea sp. 1C4]